MTPVSWLLYLPVFAVQYRVHQQLVTFEVVQNGYILPHPPQPPDDVETSSSSLFAHPTTTILCSWFVEEIPFLFRRYEMTISQGSSLKLDSDRNMSSIGLSVLRVSPSSSARIQTGSWKGVQG